MKKKTPSLLTDEERTLFREQMKNVTPLSKKKQIQAAPSKPFTLKLKTTPIHLQKRDEIEEICPLGTPPIANISSSESIKFFRPGLQFRQIQRLQRGDMKLEATLDLHGLNVIQAHQALYEFLQNALLAKQRCVYIIHGKGDHLETTPILKNKVNQWLRSYASVLGFCSAKQKDGGTGAVYVLLKSFKIL